ncbi:hypothetical protein R3P38DRAFT_2911137 [Favolaschia claudopus]|uniref:Uncharacterized protein n=1 Tax=Favolaschia claudopus TaxID=2862362 RepID=A0AAW0CB87_9AGAR
MVYHLKFTLLFLAILPAVLSAPQPRSQCGPGPYDPKCPPQDICCHHGGLGNICQPKISQITCPAPIEL